MLTIKQGDTRNAIHATILKDEVAVNLTGSSVTIHISGIDIQGLCSYLDAVNGEIFYPLEKSVTDVSGLYTYEFVVKYPDGREETFPNDDYLRMHIMKEVK